MPGGSPDPKAWQLPEHLKDRTAVLFAASYPGLDATVAEVMRYAESQAPKGASVGKLVRELRRRLEACKVGCVFVCVLVYSPWKYELKAHACFSLLLMLLFNHSLWNCISWICFPSFPLRSTFLSFSFGVPLTLLHVGGPDGARIETAAGPQPRAIEWLNLRGRNRFADLRRGLPESYRQQSAAL